MKRILYLIALLPLVSQAQSFQIGISGGAGAMSKPASNQFSDTKGSISPAFMLTAAAIIKGKWIVGVDATILSLSRHETVTIIDPDNGSYQAVDMDIYLASPAIVITPSASYQYKGGYIGLQGGVVLAKGRATTRDQFYYEDNTGYCIGAHIGHSWGIYKGLRIFSDGRANYMLLKAKSGPISQDVNFLQSQISVGLQYRL